MTWFWGASMLISCVVCINCSSEHALHSGGLYVFAAALC